MGLFDKLFGKGSTKSCARCGRTFSPLPTKRSAGIAMMAIDEDAPPEIAVECSRCGRNYCSRCAQIDSSGSRSVVKLDINIKCDCGSTTFMPLPCRY